jgi:hypothetical protein
LPYNIEVVGKKIAKKLEDLNNVPPNYIGQSYAVEIIPYEDLTAMLLQVVAPPENSPNVAIIENEVNTY